jgi:predicted transcriptional regulator
MATNLRLPSETAADLRRAAEASGSSQQRIVRDAIDAYLRLGLSRDERWNALIESGDLVAPRAAYRRPARLLTLADGVASHDLLANQRDDRL